MRIAHVPYTRKHVTTLDLVRPDEILYRDETWPRPQLGSLQPSAVIGGTPVVAGEADRDNNNNNSNNNNNDNNSDKMGAPLEEHGETGPLVPCKVCNRTFLEDRISKHAEVCHKTTAKQRPVYDVVGARVGGTDAGELVAQGKLKLEPAKPMEKKSELMKKINFEGKENSAEAAKGDAKQPAPAAGEKGVKVAKGKGGEAFQVVFNESQQKMKVQKPSTAFSHSKLPPIVMKQGGQGQGQDLRRLSAKNWKKQRVSPDFNSSQTSFSDDDVDFLASSMVSQKTVCSDAFDFLFDENNLNPEQALHKEFNRQPSTITEAEGLGDKKPLTQKESSCCVIS